MTRPRPLLLVTAIAALAALAASCGGDPVRDAQIQALGGEDPNVAQGPDHRPGQPCVLCHSDGGPASDHPFAVAGTIYMNDAPGSPGAANVGLGFVDTNDGAPGPVITTSASGNFFVRTSEWPRMTFPFRVGLYNANDFSKPVQPMVPPVDREGSCNFCHQPNPAPPLSPDDSDALRSSIGQIAFQRGGS